ncbi:MAG: hypothetical protein NDJ89_12570 [Oligoflexia bacterium]|nr:hypothetical protein [Oligoflexia bacterium]
MIFQASYRQLGIAIALLTLSGCTPRILSLAESESNGLQGGLPAQSGSPLGISYAGAVPASPSSASSPGISGTLSEEASSVKLYADSTCATEIGFGTSVQFTGSGIPASVAPNAVTSVYGKAFDSTGNASACTALTSYTHDSAPPTAIGSITHAATENSLSQTPPVSWSGGGSDALSGLNRYEYSIGSSAGGTDLLGWTNAGAAPSFPLTIGSLSLSSGQTYYVNVRAVDNAGNASAVTGSGGWIAQPVAISPATRLLAVGNSYSFSATGGQTPYVYSILSGGGSIDAGTGLYTAPGTAGTATVRVTDNTGRASEATVTINPALSLSPPTRTVTANSSYPYTFTSSGGASSPSYSMLSGPGSVDPTTGSYTAPSSSASSVLRVTDALGNSATANITNLRFRTNGSVLAAVTDGTSWYLGGSFTAVNPHSAPSAIALDSSGNLLPSCDWQSGFNGAVLALAVSGGALYVGGGFTTYQGQSANYLAKIDATTCALDTTFSPPANNGFNGNVNALAVSGSSLFVGGAFTAYRGILESARRLAKLDLTSGAIDTSFSPPGAGLNGFNSDVHALAVSGSSLYVGGAFANYKSTSNSAIKLAKLDLTTGAIDTTFSPPGAGLNGFSSTVYALVVSGGSLYVGGNFTAYKGIADSANRLAKLDLTTGAIDTGFSPVGFNANGFNGTVYALGVSGGSLYVGGNFTAYKGIASSANRLAKLDLVTGAIDTVFSPVGANGTDSVVYALAVNGTSVYAGGSFTKYRGESANRLAKVDLASGTLDSGFLPSGSSVNGFNGNVTALASSGGTVFAGGAFTAYGGTSANSIAKFDAATWALDATFSPSANNGFDYGVQTLLLQGGSLYVGGEFSAYRGVPDSANGLAKLDPASGAIDTAFSPVGASANGFDYTVKALASDGAALYVGGGFNAYRGVASSANRLAKLDLATGAIDTTFSPVGAFANGFDADVNALIINGSSLYVGGQFTDYKGVSRSANYLAKLDLASGAIDTGFSPVGVNLNGFNMYVFSLAINGSSLYVGGAFSTYKGVAGSASALAKLDLVTGAIDTIFSPVGAGLNGFNSSVWTLAVSGASLYVGGVFTAYKGVADSALRIAKLDLSSGAIDTTFSPPGAGLNGFDNVVSTLVPAGTSLFAGGSFSTYRSSRTYNSAVLSLADGASQD